jgi:riboflavin-specific deaminase-like protein
MRAAADAVMVGAGTARRDDPLLTVREVEGRDPVRVVVSHAGALPLDGALARTASTTPTLVLATRVEDGVRRALRARGIEVLEMGDAGLRAGLGLRGGRGLLDVLGVGGPGRAGALLGGGLVDRLTLFIAPLLVGRGAPDLIDLPAVESMSRAMRLTNVTWERTGDDLMLNADVGSEAHAAPATEAALFADVRGDA